MSLVQPAKKRFERIAGRAKQFPKLKLKRVTRIIEPAHVNWLNVYVYCTFLNSTSQIFQQPLKTAPRAH